MDDKTLADAAVALGVGSKGIVDSNMPCWIAPKDHWPLKPQQFVCDWRVAGALMEKIDVCGRWEPDVRGRFVTIYCADKKFKNKKYRHIASDESLPRAIIEACVEALS